jgi:hypothetical protein
MNSGLGVYAIDSNSISNPLNGSNTINVSQAGDDNINFNLQPIMAKWTDTHHFKVFINSIEAMLMLV